MEIGTGIVIGCAILGGVGTILKFLPSRNNNPTKYVSQTFCDARFEILNETMKNGFIEIRDDFKEVRKKIDEIRR